MEFPFIKFNIGILGYDILIYYYNNIKQGTEEEIP